MRTCDFCDREPAAWMHTLDPEKSSFRIYGKGHVWANEIALGESCERLYRDGDDEALADAHWEGDDLSPADLDEQIRKPLQVFRAADTAVQSMAQWRPPGAQELIEQGFVALEELTGDDEIVAAWPAQHRQAVPETRPNMQDFRADPKYWLVRSPWPAVGIEDVFGVLWDWEEARCPRRADRVTDEERATRAAARREFFQLDEAAVQELLRAQA